jgi:hypothetical protein
MSNTWIILWFIHDRCYYGGSLISDNVVLIDIERYSELGHHFECLIYFIWSPLDSNYHPQFLYPNINIISTWYPNSYPNYALYQLYRYSYPSYILYQLYPNEDCNDTSLFYPHGLSMLGAASRPSSSSSSRERLSRRTGGIRTYL